MTDPNAPTDPAPAPRSEQPTVPESRSPRLSYGERCVEWCLAEMRRAVVPDRLTLASWFEACERRGQMIGRGLAAQVRAGNRLNHCAATQSAAALACKLPTDFMPHRYRAAARELMQDAMESRCWHGRADVLAGWRPRVGDLAIYDRSTPGKPETAWLGHVDRAIEIAADDFENVGANEGPAGAWRVNRTRYDAPKLLGFVAYPVESVRDLGTAEPTIEDRAHVLALVGLTLEESERRWWEGDDEPTEPGTPTSKSQQMRAVKS